MWKSILLCAGLAMCLVGCGAAAEDAAIEEDAASVQNTQTEDATETQETENTEESITAEKAEQSNTEAEDSKVSLEGLSLSILGDSISTYDEWTVEGGVIFYPFNGEVTDVSQTWWKRLLDDTGMELCSNNSSSGSTCVGDSMNIDNPKYACSSYRLSLLTGRQGKMPDVIIVYMGTNDVLNGVPIGDNDGTKLVEEGTIENFSDAYCLILDKLASEYPAAEIYCCTLPPIGDWGTDQPFVTFENELGLTSRDYSQQIEDIADSKNITVIDLSDCGIEIDNLDEMTTDGVHPTPAGMECLEQVIYEKLCGMDQK